MVNHIFKCTNFNIHFALSLFWNPRLNVYWRRKSSISGPSTQPQSSQPTVPVKSKPVIVEEEGGPESLAPFNDEDLPYGRRVAVTEILIEHLLVPLKRPVTGEEKKEWLERYAELYASLRKVFCFDLIQLSSQNTAYFLLDMTSFELVTLLGTCFTKITDDLRQPASQAHMTSSVLLIHVSPPNLPGIVPDVSQRNIRVLNLVNLHFKTEAAIDGLTELVNNNPELWRLDLAFTAVDTQRVRVILDIVAPLKRLAYLGMRGNRIHTTIVQDIIKLLKNKDYLPSLCFIDLQNNIDIVAVPNTLVELLRRRWPKDVEGKPIDDVTFRDLAEGRVVVTEKGFHMNI